MRVASIAKPASLMPNVVGSAWTPCVRPTQTVSTCSRARSASASANARAPGHDDLARGLQLQRERRVEHVAGRQAEVDPAPGVTGRRAQHVDERGDVVVGDRLALLHRLHRERRGADPLELVLRRAVHRLAGGDLDATPGLHPRFVGPQGADLRARVSVDHRLSIGHDARDYFLGRSTGPPRSPMP